MEILPHIFKNNQEWSKRIKEEHPDFFKQLAEQQKPEYLWIGCSDSRVPANQIMDLQPGEVFVHRNIANVVVHSDLNSQAVVQFSVEVLHVKHIIVCGHYGCGGVRAAMEKKDHGLIDNWLQHIKDVGEHHREELGQIEDHEKKVNRFCELNVRAQVNNLCRSPFVQKAWEAGQELSVHGWIYGLEDGLLHSLDVCISTPKQAAAALEHTS